MKTILFNLLICFFFIACNGTGTETRTGNEVQHTNDDDLMQGEAVQIRITEEGFAPDEIRIPAGTIVEWVNYGNELHNIVSQQGSGSADLHSGDAYRHQFNNPGSFTYSCTYHPEKSGIVIVE